MLQKLNSGWLKKNLEIISSKIGALLNWLQVDLDIKAINELDQLLIFANQWWGMGVLTLMKS
jgi:hypothetical protein